jgi:uncharacterized membrane protein
MSLPPIPAWDAVHVLIVHFPIALLMAAVPIMLLLAVLFPHSARQFAIAAGVLLVVGAAAAFLATQTGEAAQTLAEQMGAAENPAIHEAIEVHSDMAETVRNSYIVFAGVFVLYLIFSGLRNREWSPAVNGVVLFIFLLASMGGALLVANTAHSGGMLVHTDGLLAPLTRGAEVEDAAAAAAGSQAAERVDDTADRQAEPAAAGD